MAKSKKKSSSNAKKKGKKTSKKKAAKKVAKKKVAKKKVAKKATSKKKAAKKASQKKIAKKQSTKKAAKKTAKKSSKKLSKKAAKKASSSKKKATKKKAAKKKATPKKPSAISSLKSIFTGRKTEEGEAETQETEAQQVPSKKKKKAAGKKAKKSRVKGRDKQQKTEQAEGEAEEQRVEQEPTSTFAAGRAMGLRYTDEGELICREVACDHTATTGDYCRAHYIKNWRRIKHREMILREGKLNRYIEELVAKYPDKYIEAIRNDLADDSEFGKVISDLELTESSGEDFEGESSESIDSLIDNIRRDFEEGGDDEY